MQHTTGSPRDWNPTICALLEKAAYRLDDEESLMEICARTEMSREEVLAVLEGSRSATVECLYRLADMLNVPAADLINPTNRVFQCFSIDGGRPRTISLTSDDTLLQAHLSDLPLLYAEDLDGSYALIPETACVIFVNREEEPEAGKLYLIEGNSGRYVRRCVCVDLSKKQAHMTDDSGEQLKMTTLKYGKMKSIGPDSEMILGRVICSFSLH